MKQSTRILAYSALALVVMLAAFGAIAFDTSNVAYAQGTVPAAPRLTADSMGPTSIDLSWNAVDDAARYELWAWDSDTEWQQLDDGSLTATSHSHTGLTSGTTYYYQIRGINAEGVAGGWSDRVNEVAGDAPDAPALTTTPGYQQITVEWPPVTGATRYELWAWFGSWTQLDGGAADPLTANSYVHDGLTTGRTYYFQGRAVTSAGVMSAWSAQVDATVLSTPNITAPTSFSAARGDGQVTLTWSAPSNLAGLTIAKFQYRYRESGETFNAWVDAGNDGTETVTGLTNSTTYDFELQAVSTTDAVGATASLSVTPSTVPSAPSLTAEGIDTTKIRLTWTAPTDNGGAEIDWYHIELLNDQGTYSPVTRVRGTVTTWTHTGRIRATQYTYRVFAQNVAGNGDWDSATALTLANPVGVPSAPTGVGATAGSGKVDLAWGAPSYNGGSPVTAYLYSYKVTTGGSYRSYINVGTDLKAEITGLTPGTFYTFAVQARNSAGTSDPAESLSVAVGAHRADGRADSEN